MTDYIEREAAIDAISEWLMKALHPENMSSYNEGERAAYRTAISEIAELPAADVRPVVLCKDCMYAPSGTDDGKDQGFPLEWPHDEWPEDNPCPCKCDDGWYSHKPKPDFFCAKGKREES